MVVWASEPPLLPRSGGLVASVASSHRASPLSALAQRSRRLYLYRRSVVIYRSPLRVLRPVRILYLKE